MEPRCNKCPLREKYDRKPQSWIGRFWRWHISFCPGWKKFMKTLDEHSAETLREKYHL